MTTYNQFNANVFANAVLSIYTTCRYALSEDICKNIVMSAINCCDYDYQEAYAFLKDVLQAQNPNWEKIPEAYGYKRICQNLLNYEGYELTEKLKTLLKEQELIVKKEGKNGTIKEVVSGKGKKKDYEKCFIMAHHALKVDLDLALLDICLDQQGWKRIVTHIIKIALGVLPCPVSVPSAVSGYAKELAEMPVPEVVTKHKKATAASTPKTDEIAVEAETKEVSAASTPKTDEIAVEAETQEVADTSTPKVEEVVATPETKEVADASTPKVEEVAVEAETKEVADATKDVVKKKKGRAGMQIEQWSSDGKTLMRIFKSQLAASIETGINRSSIVKCLGPNPTYATAGGYIWKLHTPEAEAAESESESVAEAAA